LQIDASLIRIRSAKLEAGRIGQLKSNLQQRGVVQLGSLALLEVFSVDATGNADIFRRVFVQGDVDDLWIRSD
jgi:hypothetical protein